MSTHDTPNSEDDTDTDDKTPDPSGPPGDHDHGWGERTKQWKPHQRPIGDARTDAEMIRTCFGIAKFDIDPYLDDEIKTARMVFPDLLLTEKDPAVTDSERGTDVLIKGDRDSGKTTLARALSLRAMEDQSEYIDGLEPCSEKVVWRGSSERSGWLPYKPWTVLYLPANATVSAEWMSEDDTGIEEVDDLESVVREVVRYEGIYDLLDKLGERPSGTFNVVYPDPSFTDCEEITERTNRIGMTLPFTPGWETEPGESATPNVHWWFAFAVARTEHGPFDKMTLVFDEANDLFPKNASNDDHFLAKKVNLLRSVWASSRKRLLSLVFFVHNEKTIHGDIRREFKWRIHMPDGTPNPNMNNKRTLPVGMDSVPMYGNLMDKVGDWTALCYDNDEFCWFQWDETPYFPADEDRWLKITFDAPENVDVEETESVDLEFDDQVFGLWENGAERRLMPLDPGDGYVDIGSAEVAEPLESPIEGLEFRDELVDRDTHREVVMTDGSEERVVARIPTTDDPLTSAAESGGGGR